MIDIQVKLYATLIQALPQATCTRYGPIRAGRPIEIALVAGSCLADLVDHLGLPRPKVRVAFVNGRAQDLDYALQAGDQVGIFPPVGGG
jgi:molybdopterin converting factor small subunit